MAAGQQWYLRTCVCTEKLVNVMLECDESVMTLHVFIHYLT